MINGYCDMKKVKPYWQLDLIKRMRYLLEHGLRRYVMV